MAALLTCGICLLTLYYVAILCIVTKDTQFYSATILFICAGPPKKFCSSAAANGDANKLN